MANFAGGVDIGLGKHCVNNLKSNVDAKKDEAALNYDLASKTGKPNFGEMLIKQQAILKRVHCYNHKKLIKLECMLLTMPEDVRPGDERKFFEAAKKYMDQNFGGDKPGEFCVSATVHLNENRPHMHYLFVPCCRYEPKKKKANAPKWKCCHNDVVNKKMLDHFHPRISEFISSELGYQVSILKNDLEDRKGIVSKNLKDFKEETKQKYVSAAKAEQAEVISKTDELKKTLEVVETVANKINDKRVEAWKKVASELDELPSVPLTSKKIINGDELQRLKDNVKVLAADEEALIARGLRLDARSRELEETAKRQEQKDAEQAQKEVELIDREKAVVGVEALQKNLEREIDRKADSKLKSFLMSMGSLGYFVTDLIERAQRYAKSEKPEDVKETLGQLAEEVGEGVREVHRAAVDKWAKRDRQQSAQEQQPKAEPQKNLGRGGNSR